MKSFHEVAPISKIVFILVLAVAVVSGSGCSVALKHKALTSPSQTYTDEIGMSKRAEGIEGKVGWGRFTLFYLPIVPIYIEGDGNEKLMEQISDALKQVGYKVIVVDPGSSVPGPVLKCKVDRFRFNNYTWLFPLVPTWGRIELSISVLSPDGKSLWSHNFRGSGSTLNFFNGFSSAANKSMLEILNDMVKEFSSKEFHQALTQT